MTAVPLRRATRTSGAVLAGLAVLAACGAPGGASTVHAKPSFEGRGPITYVAGKDATGSVQLVLDRWNKLHPKEKVTFVQLPTDPDAQRQQMIQNAQTKSDAYTVLSLDVVWTSEFAAHRWVDPLPQDRFPLRKMLKPIVETGKYRGGLYAVPASSDGGMLYYRTDLLKRAGIKRPPATWAEMKADCAKVRKLPEAKGMHCYAGQFQKYEGLTVNFAEAVNSAGGLVTDPAGAPRVDTPQARRGLDFLVDSFKDGTIPKDAITYQEEDGRRAFQAGKLIFERQWPYMYPLVAKEDGSSKVAGRFAVAPLPGLTGPGASSLGGHNVALSASAENKATALDFMEFLTSEKLQRFTLATAPAAPTFDELYKDPKLVKKYPYLPTLKRSILHAVPRPRVFRYGDVTAAIQREAYAAMTGSKNSAQALKDLQKTLRQQRAAQ
ncbi:ABC transporter substrate-binding protein [Streptomyces piniterrae]|uniref:ABC transporter substrate-binding protein n=1 Tax=Streptomyces piniterrae TaxID=2571125 RepID=A0A4U0NX38_9ACTN|nr:ABC transporter substrate-binding protein [Streptomyces piniterrae]TJZ59309.1 ABC transporter substrate-binding protein [Streptomyces piniterrae]